MHQTCLGRYRITILKKSEVLYFRKASYLRQMLFMEIYLLLDVPTVPTLGRFSTTSNLK